MGRQTQETPEVVDCATCGRVAAVPKLAHAAKNEDFAVEVFICPSCDVLILTGGWIEYGSGGQPYLGGRRRLWPSATPSLDGVLSSAIAREFDEAHRCMSVRSHAACAVMVRRVLEGICAELNASGKTLFKQLDDLRERGEISDELAEWSHALRFLGNTGAHFSEAGTSREDAQDALDFAAAFATHLFVLQPRFAEFEKRQQQQGEEK